MAYLFDITELKGITPISQLSEDNLDSFYKPDVMSGDFVLNEYGWPRSDIAILNEQTSIDAAQVILNKLVEVPTMPSNSDLSDAEIMLQHRSKYQQTPSEVTAYIERQLQIRDADAMKKAADDSIKFDESDKKIIDEA